MHPPWCCIQCVRTIHSQYSHHTHPTPQATPYDNISTFPLRYFLCKQHWRRNSNGQPGPIFFYLGNEADVTLYLNATGLMWEGAAEFGALLLFAEHRYYGLSKPYPPQVCCVAGVGCLLVLVSECVLVLLVWGCVLLAVVKLFTPSFSSHHSHPIILIPSFSSYPTPPPLFYFNFFIRSHPLPH